MVNGEEWIEMSSGAWLEYEEDDYDQVGLEIFTERSESFDRTAVAESGCKQRLGLVFDTPKNAGTYLRVREVEAHGMVAKAEGSKIRAGTVITHINDKNTNSRSLIQIAKWIQMQEGKVSLSAANRFAANPFLCSTLKQHVKKGYPTTDGVDA